MTAYFVHGWRSRGDSMDRLMIECRALGLESMPIKYGRTFWRGQTEQKSFHAVVQLTKVVKPGDVVVGHSNAGNVIHDALRAGMQARMGILLSPALDADIDTSDYRATLEEMHVWYTSKDWAVRFARFVPHSDWGDMGAKGYIGDDERFTNTDYTSMIGGHCGWFSSNRIRNIAKHITEVAM